MSDFLHDDDWDPFFWDNGFRCTKSNQTSLTSTSPSGYGSGIRSAYGAGRRLGSTHRVYLSHTTHRISKAVGKKLHALNRLMWIPSAGVATPISVLSPMSTWTGKSSVKAKPRLIKSSSFPVPTRKKTANWKHSIGNSASRMISRFKLFISLVLLNGMSYLGAKQFLNNWFIWGAFVVSLWFVNETIISRK